MLISPRVACDLAIKICGVLVGHNVIEKQGRMNRVESRYTVSLNVRVPPKRQPWAPK